MRREECWILALGRFGGAYLEMGRDWGEDGCVVNCDEELWSVAILPAFTDEGNLRS